MGRCAPCVSAPGVRNGAAGHGGGWPHARGGARRRGCEPRARPRSRRPRTERGPVGRRRAATKLAGTALVLGRAVGSARRHEDETMQGKARLMGLLVATGCTVGAPPGFSGGDRWTFPLVG